MADDLRTRIAAVLHRLYGPSLGAHPDGWDREPGGTQEIYLEDADAVIRELGLTLDCGILLDPYCVKCGIPHPDGKCGR